MNKEWHEARSKGIGGSDAGAICGINPWKTPLQVWEDKRGLAGPVDDNPAMFWGRTLEPIIRQKYSDETGREVLLPTEILTYPQYPFMLGNIDGFTRDKRLVEIKTTGYPTGWGEPGTDEIPLTYIFQVQHYMIITGFPVADVPVLIGGRDFRIYEVSADAEFQEMLIQKEKEFWELVETGVPPDPVNYEDVLRLYRRSEAKQITATQEIEEAITFLKMLQLDRGNIDEREEETKKTIMEFMMAGDTLVDLQGRTLATWKTGKPVSRLDVKALQKALPETYANFLTRGESSRRFLLKKEGSK